MDVPKPIFVLPAPKITEGKGGFTKIFKSLVMVCPAPSSQVSEKVSVASIFVIEYVASGAGYFPAVCGFPLVHCEFPPVAIQFPSLSFVTHLRTTDPSYNTLLDSLSPFNPTVLNRK